MAEKKNVKEQETEKVIGVEVVDSEGNPVGSKKWNLKKILTIGGGVVTAIIAVGTIIYVTVKSGKETISGYVESCGNEGTDATEDHSDGDEQIF